jgi:hypothetical protein
MFHHRANTANITEVLVGLGLLICISSSGATSLPEFPSNAVWSRDISQAPLNANSTAMINRLSLLGGWGNSNKFQIDRSMHVVHAIAGTPMVNVVASPQGYTDPDCEALPGLQFPLPVGGAIEGSTNYTCDANNNDCHLYVVQGTKLFESYLSNVTAGHLESGCVVIWDLMKVYPPQGRGDQCTSADAAGFPMASLLFNADEVSAASQVTNGDVGHAIRFILPNARMASTVYVHPASHAGGPSGPADTVPYGSRLRLKSTFDISGFSTNIAARVILRTMQRYGIVLADGGGIALTSEDDMFTTHKWLEFGFDENNTYLEQMLVGVPVTAFEVVETGPQIALTYNCVRVPDDFIFIDPFDY